MNQETLLQIEKEYKSPVYVYNANKIEEQYNRLTSAFSKIKKLKINYAAKALTNISILKFINKLGAGLDTVSIQEVKVGDVVGVREKSKSLETITNSLTSNSKKYDWLDWNNSDMSGKILNIPARDMIPENIKEQLIVELYSK